MHDWFGGEVNDAQVAENRAKLYNDYGAAILNLGQCLFVEQYPGYDNKISQDDNSRMIIQHSRYCLHAAEVYFTVAGMGLHDVAQSYALLKQNQGVTKSQ